MPKTLCIYHSNCADGLGAAWAVWRALESEVEFVEAKYGQDWPSRNKDNLTYRPLHGRDLLIVNFSYPLSVLRAMAAEARSILILDHHKTAQEDHVRDGEARAGADRGDGVHRRRRRVRGRARRTGTAD